MKIGFKKQTTTERDDVETPYHYTVGRMEAWDIIPIIIDHMPLTPNESGLLWNCLKYLIRFPFKGHPVKDLRKANQYLERLITDYDDNEKAGVRKYEN